MRRFTLLTLIFLFALIVIAAIVQLVAARGPRHLPGPTHGTPFPTSSSPTP